MKDLRREPLWAAAAALVLAIAIGLFDIAPVGFDLGRFLRVGENASARSFVENDVPDVPLIQGWGHDGQANYVLAATFPDLSQANGVVDSVPYRARRILYPAIVSWVPRGKPLIAALTVVNLGAIAAAAAAMAMVARKAGASQAVALLAGASVAMTPSFVASLVVDLSDALALALAAWAVVKSDRNSVAAVALLTLAALTRETTLVFAGALFVVTPGRSRLIWLIPPAVAAGWFVMVSFLVDGPGKPGVFTAPFQGWITHGLGRPETQFTMFMFFMSIFVAWRLRERAPVWALVLLAEAGVLTLVHQQILATGSLNVGRVTAWVIPLAVVALLPPPESAPMGSQIRTPEAAVLMGLTARRFATWPSLKVD